MDIFLLLIGGLCLVVGLAGAILPVPGPGLSFAGLILLHISSYTHFTSTWLVTFGILSVGMAVLDFYLPIWGTQRFGGTRYGAVGAVVGMLLGIVVLPGIGLVVGTFLGALAGELLAGLPLKPATRAAVGSLIGFLTGVLVQVLLCLAMIVYAIIGLWGHF
ncbi:DUF456 domain-containing protein [Dyadobacter tibetensis]|uniref:DUF456 domain-containing protein n=1 Tax=Dyadobacter tibetensis TaxID=1211851 RepID=UPI0004705D87|nr:DUF456 domain-containing protein [Dyadobacter tibetensis]